MPKISIVLPCYNVAQYIDCCFKSIRQQNFDDYEVICINDGSTDNTLEMLNKWELEFQNIKILSFLNQGLSQARNEGLKVAQGEYVYFCDPDDYINPGMFSQVYAKAKEGDYDAVHFGFQTIYEDQGGIHYDTAENPFVYKGNDIIRKEYMPKFFGITQEDIEEWVNLNYLWKERKQFSGVWRFLYKRKVLIDNNIWFFKGVKLFEDKLFNACFFCYANSIATMNGVFYNYIIKEKGLLTSSLFNHKGLVDDKINGIVQRERIRMLYMKVHKEDIFDCYIGTVVFSALELILKLSELPLFEGYKEYKRYRKIEGTKKGIHDIKIGKLPAKLKLPIYLLKGHCDFILFAMVKTLKSVGLKISI